MTNRLHAIYHVTAAAADIAVRATAIAVEQSVEMPVSAIDDPTVLSEIVGSVEDIADLGGGRFQVRIGLAAETTGYEPGQLLNMLFGNSSIQDDVVLDDVILPPGFAERFGGPRHGLEGLRRSVDAGTRALTCSALKPQGLPPASLARLAANMAEGGIDFIKDDHGLADQTYSRFAERVPACADAVGDVAARRGSITRYLPSLSGNLDQLRQQADIAARSGLNAVLVAPMIVGLASFHRLVRDFPSLAFMAHPAMGGAARIAPSCLLGTLFRLFGADATVFPNHGGRFGYSPAECRRLAEKALGALDGLKPTVPVPAGGMSLERVPDMLDFYGPDVMVLIGGSLLAARERLAAETARFVEAVKRHPYR
jgi:ribulose-bisphosphate carboxylase large chain